MKAAVIKSPGNIVIEDIPNPTPATGEVLLKVEACALCGTDQRVLKGEKHVDVTVGMQMLARAGHLSIFAGMPKSDPVEPTDLNLIHYLELHIHGANSSVQRDYIEARDLIAEGRIDAESLVTHQFPLEKFAEAVSVQGDPASGAMKVIINP